MYLNMMADQQAGASDAENEHKLSHTGMREIFHQQNVKLNTCIWAAAYTNMKEPAAVTTAL
jgi:hypothetical protein